tara:strand:- start:1215 stop:2294 length:1080 start_codon:yes stop_codon:yes gene_type:complete
MKFDNHFKNKKIIVTGHTGFKGSWLCLWLVSLGAKVIGISNNIPTKPSNYKVIEIEKNIISIFSNLENLKKTKKIFLKHKPDFVFHLAAQALVKKSYKNPIMTWRSNLIGTINVLESLRFIKKNCIAVIVTSDKSYKNLEIKRGYHEKDDLGGYDPYSASKGSAEFAVQSYVKSFFNKKDNRIIIGVARAGNVVGGGDWSRDRLIPDCIKSWSKNKIVKIRSPKSTRPWQHVLEALSGYLCLAINLKKNKKLHGEAFNFGPSKSNNLKVNRVLENFKKIWINAKWEINQKINFEESKLLKLNCFKAKKLLKWNSVLKFNEIINLTATWYKNYYYKNINSREFSMIQIKQFYKIYQNKIK